MEKNRFTICANNYIDCLRQEGRYSTAHVYKHAIRSFSQFCGTQSITFSKTLIPQHFDLTLFISS